MDLTQNELDQLRTAMNAELDRLIAARKPEAKQWPQVGDVAWVSYNDGVTIRANQHVIDRSDVKWHELGELFKTKQECERNIEALKVQAELRRMPGRASPPDGNKDKYCIKIHTDSFEVSAFALSRNTSLSIAGVWFESRSDAYNAIQAIGQERLQLWLDNYLQTPIGGEGWMATTICQMCI